MPTVLTNKALLVAIGLGIWKDTIPIPFPVAGVDVSVLTDFDVVPSMTY